MLGLSRVGGASNKSKFEFIHFQLYLNWEKITISALSLTQVSCFMADEKRYGKMKHEVSFDTIIKNVLLSESLTVTVPIIIMFKSKTRTALLISPTLVGPLIL